MDVTRNMLQAYLDGKLSEEENLQVQLFLASHMEEPMVQELLESRFDSDRSEADVKAVRALVSTRRKLGMDTDRRPVYWLAAAVVACLAAAVVITCLSASAIVVARLTAAFTWLGVA